MLKKIILPAAILAVVAAGIKNCLKKPPFLGDKAPEFKANSTQGKINFPEQYKGKWVILFSHPSDFTSVCTSEYMTFQRMKEEFMILNTELLGLSQDNVESHNEWLKSIKEKAVFNNMANININFPLIDDSDKKIAKKYGMIHPNISDTKTIRSVFIIDPQSTIRSIMYYPQSNGRNINEIKRLLIALQTSDKFGVVTPANWEPGQDAILPFPATKEEVLSRMKDLIHSRN